MKNIFKKTLKFITSRFFYLMIGIFLAVSFTYVYATWDQAKTGGSGQLSQSNWNALVNEIHNKCGSNCDAIATATTANNILTESNWNSLVDLVNNTLVDCTDNNGGKCFINQTSKSALDTDLAAGNIKNGITIFGVKGVTGLGAACNAGSECTSGFCVDGVCCNNACSGSTCQTCGIYSSAGAGTCGYVSSSAQDPDSECPGAFGVCYATTCSGSGYSCGFMAANSQPSGCTGCSYCNGGGNCSYCYWEEQTGTVYMSNTGTSIQCNVANRGRYATPIAQVPMTCSTGFAELVPSGTLSGYYLCKCTY